MATLPPKLYFRIGEVAGLVGVEPHVLRYWEREFRSIRPTKSAKGQRVYSRRDVENLMRVRDLLYADGFTIAGAKKKLQRTGTEPEGEAGAREADHEATPMPLAAAAVPMAVPITNAANGAGEARAPKNTRVRAALQELRSEIEALLVELGG
jgi:DNA-binding transcriptional MerR regulator